MKTSVAHNMVIAEAIEVHCSIFMFEIFCSKKCWCLERAMLTAEKLENTEKEKGKKKESPKIYQ